MTPKPLSPEAVALLRKIVTAYQQQASHEGKGPVIFGVNPSGPAALELQALDLVVRSPEWVVTPAGYLLDQALERLAELRETAKQYQDEWLKSSIDFRAQLAERDARIAAATVAIEAVEAEYASRHLDAVEVTDITEPVRKALRGGE